MFVSLLELPKISVQLFFLFFSGDLHSTGNRAERQREGGVDMQ